MKAVYLTDGRIVPAAEWSGHAPWGAWKGLVAGLPQAGHGEMMLLAGPRDRTKQIQLSACRAARLLGMTLKTLRVGRVVVVAAKPPGG